MRPKPLTYVSEQDRDWAKALRAAASLTALQELCKAWDEWVPDARVVAERMTDDEFSEFRVGLLKKTEDIQWAALYGHIAVPARLLEISLLAHQFHAPFGCAAIRHLESGGKKAARLKRVPSI